MGFNQNRLIAFESRLSEVMKKGIEKHGGEAVVAPSMQEVVLESHEDAMAFGKRLLAEEIDMLIVMTGVGFKMLMKVLSTQFASEDLVRVLAKITLVARGPKPVTALREYQLTPAMIAPEPNTWNELLKTLDTASTHFDLKGKTVAIQEYGAVNEEFIGELKKRGADVVRVPIYRWTLPDNIEPMVHAIDMICKRDAAMVLFTTGIQIKHVLQVAAAKGKEKLLRSGLAETIIASIGPTCTEALNEEGIQVDFEPSHPKMGHLLSEASKRFENLYRSKHPSGEFVLKVRAENTPEDKEQRQQSPFLKACRGEPAPHTPVWLMRQAGRYMKEYRAIRERTTFLELCKDKDLCAEVTVYAQEKIGADAAIIFSDLLVIIEPFGLGLDYVKGGGPKIEGSIANHKDIETLLEVEPAESLAYVYDGIHLTRRCLKPEIPLIGFAGCPFTLASYMIEGGASRLFQKTKTLMYSDESAWSALMQKINRALIKYIQMQIEAGADVIQLFDSWVGCLGPEDYCRYVLPYSRELIKAVRGKVPIIHFGTGTGTFLDLMSEAGGDVLGVDFHTELSSVWKSLGDDMRLQGNMDPLLLLGPWQEIEKRARHILDQAHGHAGHIFNLGHGIVPETPVENVIRLVAFVHEYSTKQRNG